jgi:hypothetical protein
MEVNGVEFQDEEFEIRARPVAPKKKTIGDWLIEKKIAKNPLQANTALLVVIVVCLIATGVALYFNTLRPVPPSHSFQIKAMQMNKQQPYVH